MALSADLGVTDFRDGMNWNLAEPDRGQYDFTKKRTGFPDEIAELGGDVSLVLNWGNRSYDGGATPYSPGALSAFGDFAAALVQRFPNVDSLEVGNEFNGIDFVRGPLREMSALERARAYVPILRSVAENARAARPGIRIAGGATHSLPGAYIWELLDAGAADWLDTLAVHPYSTPAEHFVRQLDVLRRHPEARTLPLEVTEFGHTDPALAAGHMLRNYCQFALAGVVRVIWYPLNQRDDDLVPLFRRDGEVTPAGRAYRLIAEHMEERPVVDAAPDQFGYGCQFGDDVLVLWGASRVVEVAGEVSVYDAEGNPLAPPYRTDAAAPLVLIVGEGTDVAEKVILGDTGSLADSYHQFAYPEAEEIRLDGDGFERFARVGGREMPLGTMPGQDRPGTPWVPYRGNAMLGNVRLTADALLPGWRGEPVEIVHRYTSRGSEKVNLSILFDPSPRSSDGISVAVRKNEAVLFEAKSQQVITSDIQNLDLESGDKLDIVVGPNGSADGDLTRYRIIVSRPARQ